ncbi:hypothetical protein [Clavibacter zhangzhiyongii]|jgi:hypothetical protein|uniref:hypothetical protein n=1 Tax=Clavibacter zhangzhiyongii TaxID=2768071 RepID=UPI0039DF4054
MPTDAHRPRGRSALSREEIELMVAVAWNDEGLRRGLRPLAWQMGDADFVHFIGSADAYALGSRRGIIEHWIADLGLADSFDPLFPPLHRVGADMVWTGSIDTVGMQFHYPAGPGDPADADLPEERFPEEPPRVVG